MSIRTMVSVTRHPTLQGVCQVVAQGGGARAGRKDVRGAGAAAAEAISVAIRHGKLGYHIFAPEEVLLHLPDDMRSKGG